MFENKMKRYNKWMKTIKNNIYYIMKTIDEMNKKQKTMRRKKNIANSRKFSKKYVFIHIESNLK